MNCVQNNEIGTSYPADRSFATMRPWSPDGKSRQNLLCNLFNEFLQLDTKRLKMVLNKNEAEGHSLSGIPRPPPDNSQMQGPY